MAIALVASVQRYMDAEGLARGVAAARMLEAADVTCLHELKLAVRDGVRIFETYEGDMATQKHFQCSFYFVYQ